MSKKKRFEAEEEFNPYEVDKLSKIPSGIVVIILKYWAAAAAVFFLLIGGLDIGLDFSVIENDDIMAQLDMCFKIIVVIAFGLTVFFNYIIKPIVNLMYNRRNNTYKFNMINMKGFLSLFVHFIYMFSVSFILFFVISFLGSKHLILNLFGSNAGYGIEPFSYGFCFIVVDGIFVLLKNLIWNLYQRYVYYKAIKEA
ncbi:MAG: hypothetical protein ACI35S_05750 [Anaeroplasma sp.]